MLSLFIFAIIFRILFNTCYILFGIKMCEFTYKKWFICLQSVMYLAGEAVPIMLIIGMHAFEMTRQKLRVNRNKLSQL